MSARWRASSAARSARRAVALGGARCQRRPGRFDRGRAGGAASIAHVTPRPCRATGTDRVAADLFRPDRRLRLHSGARPGGFRHSATCRTRRRSGHGIQPALRPIRPGARLCLLSEPAGDPATAAGADKFRPAPAASRRVSWVQSDPRAGRYPAAATGADTFLRLLLGECCGDRDLWDRTGAGRHQINILPLRLYGMVSDAGAAFPWQPRLRWSCSSSARS